MTTPREELSAAPSDARLAPLGRLLAVVDRLRDPGGCPWDREQTVESMAQYVLEEGHELVEAIERGDDPATVEEAGDLVMVVAMIARIASEAGRFDLGQAAEAVTEKLVRRHPHVFGEAEAHDAEAVLANWEAIKRSERAAKQEDASALAGVPVSLPALLRARRLCDKAVAAGFRWRDARGALDKLEEELGELHAELGTCDLEREGKAQLPPEQKARVEEELGDVLLAAAFLGAYLRLDPESACRAAARRFEERFRLMEAEADRDLAEYELDELIAAWRRAKRSLA